VRGSALAHSKAICQAKWLNWPQYPGHHGIAAAVGGGEPEADGIQHREGHARTPSCNGTAKFMSPTMNVIAMKKIMMVPWEKSFITVADISRNSRVAIGMAK
jgi:hypothetical protein